MQLETLRLQNFRGHADLEGAMQEIFKTLRQAFQRQSAVVLTVPGGMQGHSKIHFGRSWRRLDQHPM
ncbi:hypothetical protein D3C84_1310430 [compost metagenome]